MQRIGQLPSKIVALDYHKTEPSNPKLDAITLDEAEVSTFLGKKSRTATRLLLIENISTTLIAVLGTALDIDPIFFTDHIATNVEDFESAPPPPSMARLPSYICERGYLHLHYQQVLDSGNMNQFSGVKYALKTISNTPRNVRRLAPLAGRQLALARACCSLLVKDLGGIPHCQIYLFSPF
jgi:hypothetical protein